MVSIAVIKFEGVSGVSFSIFSCSLKMGQFYYAAKAFDVLERLDPSPEFWEGKRGACVGIFQLVLSGRQPRYKPLPFRPTLEHTGTFSKGRTSNAHVSRISTRSIILVITLRTRNY